MAGGKGGSTTTSVEVPEYIQEAAKRNLTKAEKISQLGYVPYYGPDVAAFTPLQEAAFGNVAGQAGAFGLQTPAVGAMSGMPAAQEFAGGVRGYSSAPMFEGAIAELAARRPAQKAYIDSFFIDPVTGQVGTNVAAPIDYTTAYPQVPVAPVDTGDGGGGGGYTGPQIISTVPEDQATGNVYQDTQFYNPDIDYTDAYVASNNQVVGTLSPSESSLATMEKEYGIDPSFYTDQPIYSSSDFPLGSSTQGTDYTVYDIRNDDNTPTATNKYGSTVSVGYGVGQVDPALAAAAGYSYDDGSTYDRPTFAEDLTQSLTTDVDLPGNVVTRTLNIGAGKKDESSDSGYAGSSDDGCVIATHAVSAGGFTPSMKREAVVWCMNVLHDKWWGEAIRRGYRHLGKAKIAEGKAHEHYQEFRDYIAFANGKKRTLRGAFTFAYRTAQFFAVGLVKKDA